jgi:LAO/AO transport system kinase
MPALAAAVLRGEVRALARLITLVEENDPEGWGALSELFPHTGRAHVVGITGAPGSGKSTITDQFIRLVRSQGEGIGVLAVDPSSPFSGGAILGDRVRMQDHALDADVYIRSLASRGHLGGLSAVTPQAVAILDAVGKTYVIVETVGVGQAEVEIVDSADTTVVVVTAGWGDAIQASKAGLLEIADVFVVNKADRPGASETVADLRQMLQLGPSRDWTPPILATTATTGVGIEAAWKAVMQHREHLIETGRLNEHRRTRLERELHRAVAEEMARRATEPGANGPLARLKADVLERKMDPWAAARRIAESL